MSKLETITVEELISSLVEFCYSNKKVLKYKVYMGGDAEGNNYGTISAGWSFQMGDQDKILTIMPTEDSLTDEDIAPKENAMLMAELLEKNKAKVQ